MPPASSSSSTEKKKNNNIRNDRIRAQREEELIQELHLSSLERVKEDIQELNNAIDQNYH